MSCVAVARFEAAARPEFGTVRSAANTLWSEGQKPERLRSGAAQSGERRLKICGVALALSFACAATPVAAQSKPQAEQGRLRGEYEATLVGVTVATGTLSVDVKDGQYSATFNAASSGLVGVFKKFSYTLTSRGHVINNALVPDSYHASSASGDETEEVHVSFVKGNARESRIVPEPHPAPGRIAPTEAELNGVSDDLTAFAVRAPASGAVATAAACQASTPVFNGWVRYDRKRVFIRMEEENTAVYRGPLVVCHVGLAPVAGYTPAGMKEAGAQRGGEIAFAPVAGTRLLVPFRITSQTGIGVLTIRATRFVSDASSESAAAR